MSRETFTIETVETRPITTGKRAGENFKRAKLSGIGYVSVFANGDCDFLEENVGRQATAEIKVDNAEKGWKSASAFAKVENVDGRQFVEKPGAVQHLGGGKSEADWDKKEDRGHIRALAASHRADMIAFYSSYPGAWEVSGIESYNDLWMRARKNAVRDLDWIRNYATSNPPFSEEESQ